MKKNEDAAAKKKPKTSAAQLRVQKGVWSVFGRVAVVMLLHFILPLLTMLSCLFLIRNLRD
jgi:hypothetical protein